ncbi:hypothetical protein AF72_00610 [Xylella taiwanensis]|uniref:Uncharacterized protein n=1 Tax=Xylella taiwanensis TaxID=1444770 RepID=Z9JNR3_9GAMM|nr:hypothetical protein AF72_00610 [Xylella taiwanensis]
MVQTATCSSAKKVVHAYVITDQPQGMAILSATVFGHPVGMAATRVFFA